MRFSSTFRPLGLCLAVLWPLTACNTFTDDPPRGTSGGTGARTSSTNSGIGGSAPDASWSPAPGNPWTSPTNQPPSEAFFIETRIPAADAQEVPTDAAIEISFSQALDPEREPDVRLQKLDRSTSRATDDVPCDLRVEHAALTLTPHMPLEAGETYQVVVAWHVRSTTGRSLDSQDDSRTWGFTTAEHPGTLALHGPMDAVHYDAERSILWGIEAATRELARIDLSTRTESERTPLLYVPDDLCVSPDGSRLFIVNRGTSLITELDVSDLHVIQHIPWGAPISGADTAHYHVRCAHEHLWIVDGSESPGLWSVDLSVAPPLVTNHTEQVAGIGDLLTPSDGSELLYWSQLSWAGTSTEQRSSDVFRLDPASLETLDRSMIGYPLFPRDPQDTPLFLDRDARLLVAKNRIFDADSLATVLYTFEPGENLYAADFPRQRVASKTQIYSLVDYRPETPTFTTRAEHMFFDSAGQLHFVVDDPPRLIVQTLEDPPVVNGDLDAGAEADAEADAGASD